MKKIFSIVILFLISISLVSCIKFIEPEKYESDNAYEQSIISSAELITDTNVSIFNHEVTEVNGNVTNKYIHLSNGVIFKKEIKLNKTVYYVITIASILKDYNNFSVSYKGSNRRINVQTFSFNLEHDIAILTFETTDRLKEANVLNNNSNYYLPNVGKTVLSFGSDALNNSPDSIKQGFISYIDDNSFVHDASINNGELGSGIYNSKGYLIGLNSNKIYEDSDILSGYNVLGLNKAISVNSFIGLIKNISEVDLSNKNIPNNLFTSNKVTPKQQDEDDLETKIKEVYNSNKKYVVSIKSNNYIFSGTIIRRSGNTYQILTTDLTGLENISIFYNNKEYASTNIVSINNKASVSIVEIVTEDTLPVLDHSGLNTGIFTKKERGSFVLTIGNVIDLEENYINVGTLSDTKDEFEFRFMHSSKVNFGQVGSPIFNLNGDLIGVNIYKINGIVTQSGVISAEALSYGYNIEDIYKDLYDLTPTFKKYSSNVSYEQNIIDSINNVLNKVVTVKTNNGHGSGVIYKEEANGSNYTYYVLSNEHVVEGASEVSITFNDGKKSIRAKDYYAKKSHDYSIIRFDSDVKLDYFSSEVLNSKKTIDYTIGQTVIAIGSPEDISRKGYITIGNISRTISNYNNVPNLQVNHTAPLNPGNSGGALFDLEGNLIGINVAKMTNINNLASEGMSITLNLNVLSSNINGSIIKLNYTKTIEHQKRLGISVVELNDFKSSLKNNTTPYALTNKNHLFILDELVEAPYGVVIADVDDLFESYGILKPYDIIVEVDGVKIFDNNDIAGIISGKANKNEPFVVKVLRKGNVEPLEFDIYLS